MSEERDPGPAPVTPAAGSTFGVDRGDRVHEFRGPGVSVTWSRRRCIHAAECVFNLPMVFEPGRRPWVDATAASADAIARVVARCPTGALHCVRSDGGVAEVAPGTNSVRVSRDGPLYLCGDIEVCDETGTLRLADTRVALCRCGESRSKPLCDGAHLTVGFRDPGVVGEKKPANALDAPFAPGSPGGKLRVQPEPNGPLQVDGPFTLTGVERGTAIPGTSARFCRCGHSQSKPYCDGSHQRTEFRSV